MSELFFKLANAWFATMPILVGTSLLLWPDAVIPAVFNNPPIAKSQMVDILRMGFAIRDIYMGITTWAAIYHGSRKQVGWCLLAGTCVVVVDGYALEKALGRGLWSHYPFIPLVLFLGSRQAFF